MPINTATNDLDASKLEDTKLYLFLGRTIKQIAKLLKGQKLSVNKKQLKLSQTDRGSELSFATVQVFDVCLNGAPAFYAIPAERLVHSDAEV